MSKKRNNKKNKMDLLKRGLTVFKKSSDAERKKSELRKAKKNNKPKGVGAKKFGMITFWLLFSFMFLITTVTIFGGSSADANKDVKIETNKLYENEGVEFAKEFVHEYFTWGIDKHGEERRKRNIEPYFIEDNSVDSLGGIMYDKSWASSIDKRNITLKDINEINDDQARFIFKVEYSMKSPTESKNTKIDKDGLNFDELIKEERKTRISNGYKIKDMEKYISVPVFHDEETGTFAVYDLPSFTYVEEGKTKNKPVTKLSKLHTNNNSFIQENLTSFLSTFFQSYASDSKDKLSYILEDDTKRSGLNGTMNFEKIEDIKVYNLDDNDNEFIVDAKVIMEEPSTEYRFTNKYFLVVKRKDQRYVVDSLNDEKYVNELVSEHLKEKQSDEDSENQEVEEIEDEGVKYEGNSDEEDEEDEEDVVDELLNENKDEETDNQDD